MALLQLLSLLEGWKYIRLRVAESTTVAANRPFEILNLKGKGWLLFYAFALNRNDMTLKTVLDDEELIDVDAAALNISGFLGNLTNPMNYVWLSRYSDPDSYYEILGSWPRGYPFNRNCRITMVAGSSAGVLRGWTLQAIQIYDEVTFRKGIKEILGVE